MSSEIRWQHKSFDIDDRDRVLALRERVFSEPEYDVKRWTWQYQNNPMGPSYIDLAVDKEEAKVLAGHYAVISYKFDLGNGEVHGAQSLDTFTSPDYTRQGIFVKLAEQTYSKSFDDGVKFIFGFPNKLSYPGFVKKLNFKDPFGFKVLKLPIRFGHYAKKIPGLGFLSGVPLAFQKHNEDYSFTKITEVPKDFSLFAEGCLKDIQFKIVRDEKYLSWRYLNCPDRDYDVLELRKGNELLGIVVGRVEGKFAHLVDIIPASKESVSLLVDEFIAYYRNLGIDCITCFMNEENFLESELLLKGFKTTDKSDDFRFIIRTETEELYNSSMSESKNWFLLGGDTDFY
jgi:hypothetical protein